MPRNPHVTIPAPAGVDVTSEPQQADPGSAQTLVNWACDRRGILRGTPKLLPLTRLTVAIDGVSYYYGQAIFAGTDIFGRSVVQKQPDAAGDRVIYISNHNLYGAAYANLYAGPAYGTPFAPAYPPSLQAAQQATGTAVFTTGQTLRTAQYETEMVLVQQGANSNYRYTINRLYYLLPNTTSLNIPAGKVFTLGLSTPAAPTGSPLAVGAPYVAKAGIIRYAVCYIDSFGRYSSPTVTPLTVDYGSAPYAANPNVTLSFTAPVGLDATQDVQQIAFLATVQGVAGVYYVLAKPVGGGGNVNPQPYNGTAGPYTFIDGASDLTVSAGLVGPGIGQNDPPNAASLCAVWKNRIVLNDLYDPNIVQISNDGSPTQFNTIPYNPNLPVPTNGIRMRVDQDNGNPITAFVSFGTFLAVFKRRSIFILYGDDASNFLIQPVYSGRGCVASDSAVRCEGVVLFLGDDGVYLWTGSEPSKISKKIEKYLLSYNTTTTGAYQYMNAKAAYINRQYLLWIGTVCYVYNFDMQEWSLRIFGADVQEFLTTTSAADISPIDPRSLLSLPGLVNLVPAPQAIAIPGAGPNVKPDGSPGMGDLFPIDANPNPGPLPPPGP